MTKNDLAIAQAAIRQYVDTAGYGSFISDDICRELAYNVIEAVDKHRKEVVKS